MQVTSNSTSEPSPHSERDESDHPFRGLTVWQDWHWQMRNAIDSVAALNIALSHFTENRTADSAIIERISTDLFSFKVTPSLLNSLREGLCAGIPLAWEAFCASFAPTEQELLRAADLAGERDAIGEDEAHATPVPAVTNFYERRNRVLFRVTKTCPSYCRYCFRRRMVGDSISAWDQNAIDEGLEYVRNNSFVTEVILSGGDPLILSDSRLQYLLEAFHAMPHIRRLRIDTRVLSVLPQRITSNLLSLLRSHQPLYLIAHFNHPYELSRETRDACTRLADAGIPVRSHTPLLRGVNDNENVLVALMESLLDCRVQPYYLIQFIPTKWTEHFRVPLDRGVELVEYLYRRCGGLAVPTYIVY